MNWELLWAGQSISAIAWTHSGSRPEQEPINVFEGWKEETWINEHIDMNGIYLSKPKGSEKLTPGASFSLRSSRSPGPGAPTLPTYLVLHQLRKDLSQDPSEVVNKVLNGEGASSEREKPWAVQGSGVDMEKLSEGSLGPSQSQH